MLCQVWQKDWSARKLRTQISEKAVQMIRYVSDSGWEKRDDEQRKMAHCSEIDESCDRAKGSMA